MTRRGTVIPTLLIAILACAASSSGQTDEERRLEALKSLPYVMWTESEVDESEHGVALYDSLRAFDGYTLYSGRSHATLVDMRGAPVHSWRNEEIKEWQHAEMTDDGELLVMLQRRGIYRLDWDGEVVWSGEELVHHDLDVEPDGSLLAVAYDFTTIPAISPDAITSDKIVRLDRSGRATDVWRLADHRLELLRWCTEEALSSVSDDVPDDDWSHMNAVDVIYDTDAARELGKRMPDAFAPGNAIVCIRNLDLVAVIDLGSGEFLWGWGPGELDHPHHPTLLSNGNILIFDNGFFRGWSRVIEYDPAAAEIVWEYSGENERDLFSRGRGSCQMLPNGNVLVTESAEGRVIEVTSDGEHVWEFLNPSRQMDRRGTFYRAIRYDRALVDALLEIHGE